MDVTVRVEVGTFSCEATATGCGPDACGDLLRQVTTHTIVMVGTERLAAAAGGVADAEE